MYNKEEIKKQFLSCLGDWNNDRDVKITNHNIFKLKDTINKIELARASKFKSGDTDSQGNHKFYMNILNPLCGSVTKNIDIDTKDLRCKPKAGESDRIKSYIYNEMLRDYLRENSIGRLINKMSEDLPVYGSIVLKKVGDEIVVVDWRNLWIDPSVSNENKNFDIKSRYILEKYVMTPTELKGMKVYDKTSVSSLVEEYKMNKENEIIVYEFHLDNSVAYYGTVRNKRNNITENGTIADLYNGEMSESESVYKKVDLFTVRGRALGLGVIEQNLDPQIRWNEMTNQKATSMKLSSKLLFQTRDGNMNGNMLEDLLNGDVINVESEITKIDNTERNLGAYSQEEQNVLSVARSNANASEIVTGDALPSRTPFRLGALMNENAGKLFVFIRQNLGLFWDEVITDWVLPTFNKKVIKEQLVELTDSDAIEMLNELDINSRINEATKKYVLANGYFPTDEDKLVIKDQLMGEKKRSFAKLAKGFLDFEKSVYMDVTGEQDSVAMVETMNNMLMLLAQNPQIMQDPRLIKFLQGIGAKVGIDPALLMGQAPQGTSQAQPQGGQSMGSPAENASMGANQFTQ